MEFEGPDECESPKLPIVAVWYERDVLRLVLVEWVSPWPPMIKGASRKLVGLDIRLIATSDLLWSSPCSDVLPMFDIPTRSSARTERLLARLGGWLAVISSSSLLVNEIKVFRVGGRLEA